MSKYIPSWTVSSSQERENKKFQILVWNIIPYLVTMIFALIISIFCFGVALGVLLPSTIYISRGFLLWKSWDMNFSKFAALNILNMLPQVALMLLVVVLMGRHFSVVYPNLFKEICLTIPWVMLTCIGWEIYIVRCYSQEVKWLRPQYQQ